MSKIKDLQDKVVNAEKEIAKLKELLKDATEKDGITVDMAHCMMTSSPL